MFRSSPKDISARLDESGEPATSDLSSALEAPAIENPIPKACPVAIPVPLFTSKGPTAVEEEVPFLSQPTKARRRAQNVAIIVWCFMG